HVDDIGLAIWPELGLKLTGIQVDSLARPGPTPLLTMAKATLAIPIKPLLAGTLQVREISLDNGAVNLWQNKTGNNWSGAPAGDMQQNKSAATQTPDTGSNKVATNKIEINKVALKNIALQWQDDQQPPMAASIKQAGVELKELNHFAVTLVGQLAARGTTPALAVELEQTLKQADASWQLLDGKGKIGPVNGPQFLINYHGDLSDNFAKVAGGFSVQPFNPAAYLPLLGITLADKSRLQSLSISADVNWHAGALKFTQGILKLDDTAINWQLMQNAERWQLAIKAPRLDVDAYLPPPNPTEEKAQHTSEPPPEIDLSGVPAMDISAQFDELIIARYVLNELHFKLAVDSRRIALAPVSARLYGGALDGQLNISLAPKSAELKGNLDAKGVNLEPLWKHFSPQAQMQLSGAINAQTQWQATATGLSGLAKQLNGQVTVQGEGVRLSPLNITQHYCQIISQATLWKKDNNEWPEFSQLQELTGEFAITPAQVTFNRLYSRVDKLQVDGAGSWDRQSDQLRVQLPITLLQMAEAETNIKGCTIGSDYWVNRKLSLLECKGKLATLDAKRDCGIDKAGVAGLLKDYALYKLKKGEGINVENIKEKAAEKKAELKEKLDATLDKEQVKKLEGKLKGLFKKEQ
ncbi:MAG TPA: AsmA family protein, partial [Cellvibrionaceae bacterium]|nr:AsmA family protein [Cellvibrionaceae bacterium]